MGWNSGDKMEFHLAMVGTLLGSDGIWEKVKLCVGYEEMEEIVF